MHFTFYDISTPDERNPIFGTDVSDIEGFIRTLNTIKIVYDNDSYIAKSFTYVARDNGFMAVEITREQNK